MKGVVRHGKKSGEPGLVKCVVFSGTSQRHTETTDERERVTQLCLQVQILYTDRERYEAVLLNHRRVHEQARPGKAASLYRCLGRSGEGGVRAREGARFGSVEALAVCDLLHGAFIHVSHVKCPRQARSESRHRLEGGILGICSSLQEHGVHPPRAHKTLEAFRRRLRV